MKKLWHGIIENADGSFTVRTFKPGSSNGKAARHNCKSNAGFCFEHVNTVMAVSAVSENGVVLAGTSFTVTNDNVYIVGPSDISG